MKKLAQKIPIEKEIKVMDQYGSPWGDEIVAHEKEYAKKIGEFLIVFAGLESSLDHLIITMISDRTDDPGYRIIKYLSFSNKVRLAKDQYWQMLNFISNKRMVAKNKKRFEVIFGKLVELGEFRNKVAHANWMTLDERGFVRVKIVEEKEKGGVSFEKIKITPSLMYKFSRQAPAIASRIETFKEEVWQDLHQR